MNLVSQFHGLSIYHRSLALFILVLCDEALFIDIKIKIYRAAFNRTFFLLNFQNSLLRKQKNVRNMPNRNLKETPSFPVILAALTLLVQLLPHIRNKPRKDV